nr:putative metalloprotease Tcis_Metallo_8 [Tityus cisandinus]
MYPVYIILFLFAIFSAIQNNRIDVVFPAVETSRSGMKTVKFRALDQDVELHLQPAGKILAKDFGFVDVNHKVYYPVNVRNLKSKLYRNSAEEAALLIDEDGPLIIEGIINTKLRIAPHGSRRIDKDGRIAHQIVEEISERKSYFHDAVMPVNVEIEEEIMKRMDRDGKCIVIEFLSVLESNFTKRFSNDDALTKHMSVTYMGVQNQLEKLELGIQVRLLGIHAFTNETEPSFIEDSAIPGYEKYLDMNKILRNLGKYYCKQTDGLGKDADIIMLTTDRPLAQPISDSEINKNIAGVARPSGVCNYCNKVGAGEYYEDFAFRVHVITHEAAHLIGIPHDGDDPNSIGLSDSPGALNCSFKDGYFMGSFYNKVNHDTFSECSKACARYLLSLPRADCLYEDCINDDDN